MKEGQSDTASSSAAEECETLLPLFAGPTGPVQLGRCLAGEHDGRIVLLRRVMATEVEDLEAVIYRASKVASPELIKVLGLLRKGRGRYVASEYMEGVALWELEEEPHLQKVPPDVAARVIRDALLGASAATQRFAELGVRRFQRYIFSDTVWITEFGSTLLTDVGIAQQISLGVTFESGEVRKGTFSKAPETDVQAAALELHRLLGARAESHGDVPKALNDIVDRGLSRSPRNTFATPAAMAEALTALPRAMLADEARVGRAMQWILRPTLDARRQRLAEVLGRTERATLDEPTASYRARPNPWLLQSAPSADDSEPTNLTVRPPTKLVISQEQQDEEEQTRLYQRPIDSEPEATPESLQPSESEARAESTEPSIPGIRDSTERPTRYLQLTLDTEPSGIHQPPSSVTGATNHAGAGEVEPAPTSEPKPASERAPAGSGERTWRAIAIAALTAIVVLCVGRWLKLW